MAFTYNVHMRYQIVADDVSRNPIREAAASAPGVIRSPGIVPVGGGGGTLDFYCRTGAALLLGNVDSLATKACGGNSLPMSCELAAFSTAAGAMDGVEWNDEAVTVRTRARYSVLRGGDPVDLTRLKVSYYHVTTGGAETFLDGIWFDITTSYANYSGVLAATRSWGTDELLRVKYLGKITGFGPP